ncbi:MAG: 8-oxo-dGTP diphosphatase [Candidatus Riflebacteria bacterium]|nr:8-oxo-dGTP diphosphatase [Candidatus Riflebacteria bacterium]
MRSLRPETISDIDWPTWKPRDLATLLFVIQGDRMLLIHKKTGLGAGKINGPGGRLDGGETPVECAVREVQEELCITVRDPRWAGRLHFQFLDGYSIRGDVFVASEFDGTPTETPEAAPLWVRLDAIPYDRMWADDPLWIPMMLDGRTFIGRFIFDGDRMVASDVVEASADEVRQLGGLAG